MITRYGDLDRVEKWSSLLSQLGQQRKESLNMECLYRTAYLCFLKAKEARDHVANMYVTKMVKKGESMLCPVLKECLCSVETYQNDCDYGRQVSCSLDNT